jgi:hypothetical protein
MADWVIISSLATAGGTLVLATATFGSTRSANRSARVAEQALLAGIRPLLTPARPSDPPTKVSFIDGHWMSIEGGQAATEATDSAIYLAFPIRNAGSGIAVLHGWRFHDRGTDGDTGGDIAAVAPEDFVRLTRDLYIAAGDVGFWQGAVRNPDDPVFRVLADRIQQHRSFFIDILYGDDEGGQRMVSRFNLEPKESGAWLVVSSRHRNIDRADPRG